MPILGIIKTVSSTPLREELEIATSEMYTSSGEMKLPELKLVFLFLSCLRIKLK